MIIFTDIGLFLLIKDIKCFRRTVLTKGVIIDIFYKEKYDRDGRSVTRYPIYEYYNSHGNLYKKGINISGCLTPKLGKHVVIVYNQFNPNDYYVKGDRSILFSLIFIVIGSFIQFVSNT